MEQVGVLMRRKSLRRDQPVRAGFGVVEHDRTDLTRAR